MNRRDLIAMLMIIGGMLALYFTVIHDKSTVGGYLSFLHFPNFFWPILPICLSQILTVPMTLTCNIKSTNNQDFTNAEQFQIEKVYKY
jgi:hypothetical protein